METMQGNSSEYTTLYNLLDDGHKDFVRGGMDIVQAANLEIKNIEQNVLLHKSVNEPQKVAQAGIDKVRVKTALEKYKKSLR